MAWDLKAVTRRPTYTFKLGAALTIGGIVVNRNSEPVMDAALNFWRYWAALSPMTRGTQADFSTRTVSTDAGGMWQLSVADGIAQECGFGIKHPDYVSTNITFRGDEETEKNNCAPAHSRIVLSAGVDIASRVLDGAEIRLPTPRSGMSGGIQAIRRKPLLIRPEI